MLSQIPPYLHREAQADVDRKDEISSPKDVPHSFVVVGKEDAKDEGNVVEHDGKVDKDLPGQDQHLDDLDGHGKVRGVRGIPFLLLLVFCVRKLVDVRGSLTLPTLLLIPDREVIGLGVGAIQGVLPVGVVVVVVHPQPVGVAVIRHVGVA